MAEPRRAASRGGPKGRPPLDPPPAINHLPFSIRPGRRGHVRAREAGESVIFVVRELYGVGLRPSFSSGDCCTTRRMSAQHKFELESVGLVLGGPAGAAPSDVQCSSPAAMNSSTSHRPAAAQ